MTIRDSDASAAGADEVTGIDCASPPRQAGRGQPGWRGVLAIVALIAAAAAGYAAMFLIIDYWRGG
jgi:hypothetical protein